MATNIVTVSMHICPVCNLDGEIWIPIWREDVEGWGDERVSCPCCLGKGALTKEEWQQRIDVLRTIDPTDPPAPQPPAAADGGDTYFPDLQYGD